MAQSHIQALKTENQKLRASMAQAQEKAASALKDMQDFILFSGNQLRFQEFQLQREDERKMNARNGGRQSVGKGGGRLFGEPNGFPQNGFEREADW